MSGIGDIKIKVCGMRDPANIAEVARLGTDYLGFIFYRGTPRYVGDDFVIPHNLPSTVRRVGVFVNEQTDVVLEKVRRFRLDFVQLHGSEPAAQCRALKSSGVGVIKVFSVDEATNFGITRSYVPDVDFFLFDTKGRHFGGNGTAFDWEVLRRYDQQVPFFLSGGINPDNATAIGQLAGLNLHAVDLNSGVERGPADKDPAKVQEVQAIIRNIK